jgi:hypothetical protein
MSRRTEGAWAGREKQGQVGRSGPRNMARKGGREGGKEGGRMMFRRVHSAVECDGEGGRERQRTREGHGDSRGGKRERGKGRRNSKKRLTPSPPPPRGGAAAAAKRSFSFSSRVSRKAIRGARLACGVDGGDSTASLASHAVPSPLEAYSSYPPFNIPTTHTPKTSSPPSLPPSLPTCSCRSITSTHRPRGDKKPAAALPPQASPQGARGKPASCEGRREGGREEEGRKGGQPMEGFVRA